MTKLKFANKTKNTARIVVCILFLKTDNSKYMYTEVNRIIKKIKNKFLKEIKTSKIDKIENAKGKTVKIFGTKLNSFRVIKKFIPKENL